LYSNYRTQLERELKGEDWNDNANLLLPQTGLFSNSKTFRTKQIADDLISLPPMAMAREASGGNSDREGSSLLRQESKGLGLNIGASN